MIKFLQHGLTLIIALMFVNIGLNSEESKKSEACIPCNSGTMYLFAASLMPDPMPSPRPEGTLLENKKIKIINLGPVINHSGVDYAPTISADGKTLFYVSNKPGSVMSEKGKPSHDFWVAKKNDRLDTVFLAPYNLDPSNAMGLNGINTILNEGAASIAADRQSLYFTACNRPDGFGSCDIYKTTIEGEKWGRPVNLGKNINSKGFDSQPSIAADQSRIYFVSNRPYPGYSDGDDTKPENFNIWYSDFDEETEEWKPAKFLDGINTTGRDVSPFIGADGVSLFFASDGYPDTKGGQDFYTSTYDPETKKWSAPKNLGEPINTKEDEQFISLPASGDIIYFSSQRSDLPGAQGSLDVYMAFVPSFFKAVNLVGTVVDECSGDFIPATLTIKNPVVNKTFKDSVSFTKQKFEKIIVNDEYGGGKDAAQYINFEVTAENPKYGKKTEIVRVNKPKPTDDKNQAGVAAEEVVFKISLGQRPSITTEIAEATYVTNNKERDKSLSLFNGLVMEEVTSWDLYPLLGYVFFDLNSAKLPERYNLFESSEEAKEFKFTDTTIVGGTLNKYYHVLNIYGYRLTKFPNTKLTITGTNDNVTPEEKGNIELSKKRAQTVYDYLVKVWKIAPERLEMKSVNFPNTKSNPNDTLGWQENRRVELYCSEWEVAKPVFDKDPKISPQPETMDFVLNNGIEDGLIAGRRIEIKRNDQPWKTITDTKITDPKAKWDWKNNDGKLPKDVISPDKYTATLFITTKTGKECVSEPIEIPIMHISSEKKKAVTGSDTLFENYSLILFPFNSADGGPLNEKIMNDYVYNRCQPTSVIDVTGHTDVIGLYDTNKKLSDRRAESVYKGIGKKTGGKYKELKSKGVGEDSPLYTNDLPEGRFYNRTVQVLIKTPVGK